MIFAKNSNFIFSFFPVDLKVLIQKVYLKCHNITKTIFINLNVSSEKTKRN